MQSSSAATPNGGGRGPAKLLLAGIVAAACGLRVVSLSYGLPAVFNPDEIAIMTRALAFAQGDLNPHNFLYPTFYFYVLFIWEGLWFLAGRTFGIFESLEAFERSFFLDPSLIYLAGRALTLTCGVLTVWATYRLGTRLFDRTTGLTAALLLAVAPLAVRDSHYIKHDVPVALLIVLTHLALAELTAGGGSLTSGARTRWTWPLAGALAGLAMSTHYYAVFLVVPLGLCALLRNRTERSRTWPRLLISGGACVIAFVAASPFLITEPSGALRDIVANRQIVMDRAMQSSGTLGSAGFYLQWLSGDAAGTVTFLLAIAGAVLVMTSGWRTTLLSLGFAIPFFLFIANTYPASRYLNAVLPFLTLLAGRATSWVAARGGVWRALGVGLAMAAATEAGAASVRADQFIGQPDTRTLALRWMEEHVASGTSILIQPYSVPVRPSREGLVEALTLHLGAADRASPKFQRQLALSPYPEPAYRTLYLGTGGLDDDKIYVSPDEFRLGEGLTPLRARAVTHVVLKRYNVVDPAMSQFDAALAREGRLLVAFSPYRSGIDPDRQARVAPFIHNTDSRISPELERPGPIIEIWTIN